MSLPDRLRLPFAFDPGLLARDLERLASVEWTGHFVKQNYEGDWSVIPLRAAAGARHPVMMIYSDPSATAFENTPMLESCSYFQRVLAAFECPICCVRLMRLAPGSIIKEHRDNDLSFEDGNVRFHIPILSNTDVEFFLNGSRIVMEPGSVWYLRLSDPHKVANRGTSDRVHLVIDARVNDWLTEVLKRAAWPRETVSISLEGSA
jgi:hypothetical protein